ncbi:hypothetical protein QVD17_09435 [Tagetes erecta]|uniref:Uncharacterized protein n=1 Tax=Tagetes erecta TaxID=13708 RepID=A0AAD8L0Y5_TARER|nr:hypothetical protein QVD17_09435 [Tagetes erecta]
MELLPVKVDVFVWRATKKRIPTRKDLVRDEFKLTIFFSSYATRWYLGGCGLGKVAINHEFKCGLEDFIAVDHRATGFLLHWCVGVPTSDLAFWRGVPPLVGVTPTRTCCDLNSDKDYSFTSQPFDLFMNLRLNPSSSSSFILFTQGLSSKGENGGCDSVGI